MAKKPPYKPGITDRPVPGSTTSTSYPPRPKYMGQSFPTPPPVAPKPTSFTIQATRKVRKTVTNPYTGETHTVSVTRPYTPKNPPLPKVVNAGVVAGPPPVVRTKPVPTPRSAPTDSPRPTSYRREPTSVIKTSATPPASRPPKKTKKSKNPGPGTTVDAGTVMTPTGARAPAGTTGADPITAWVNAAQLPQLQAIQNAQAQSELAAKNAATTTTGYYGALGDVLKGIGPATQAGYSTAAGNDSAFAKGFSDGLAHVQGQTSAEGANIAGIAGGTAPASANLGGTGATDALYGLGGYIPATTMDREGAAFGAAANNLPNTAAGIGAADIAQINAKQREDQQGFTKNYADLAAQVPGLRLTYGAELAKQNLARETAANREADVRRQQAISYILATGTDANGNLTPRARAQLASALGTDPVTGKPTASTVSKQKNTALAQSRLDLATVKEIANETGLVTGADGKPVLGSDGNPVLTPAGQRAATAEWKARHAGKKGGFTKYELSRIADKASTTADTYRFGKVVNDRYGNPDPTKSVSLIPDYQDALRKMVSGGVPLSIAQRALNVYWPKGNDNKGKVDDHGSPLPYGRPYLTVQMRKVLEDAGYSVSPMTPPTDDQIGVLAQHGIHYQGPATRV